ncbi:MAG: hypothetical protein SNJ52_05140 [Verrucomicrobiia bacterium]
MSCTCVGLLTAAQQVVRHLARWVAWCRLARRPAVRLQPNQKVPARITVLAKHPIDRAFVLKMLQHRLASAGWAVVGDAGWSCWDLKVWDSATVWVEINALVEAMENGREWVLSLRLRRRGLGLSRLTSGKPLRAELHRMTHEIVLEFERQQSLRWEEGV